MSFRKRIVNPHNIFITPTRPTNNKPKDTYQTPPSLYPRSLQDPNWSLAFPLLQGRKKFWGVSSKASFAWAYNRSKRRRSAWWKKNISRCSHWPFVCEGPWVPRASRNTPLAAAPTSTTARGIHFSTKRGKEKAFRKYWKFSMQPITIHFLEWYDRNMDSFFMLLFRNTKKSWASFSDLLSICSHLGIMKSIGDDANVLQFCRYVHHRSVGR